RPIAGLDHQVTRVGERIRHQAQQVEIIVGNENFHQLSNGSAGIVSVKRVNPCGVRAAVSWPPWRSTIEREIHNPSPRPPGSGSCDPPRLKRSKMLTASPSGRPGPASSTQAVTWRP